MSWADNTFCGHGLSFNQDCEYCEMESLVDELKVLRRRLIRKEKRFAELDKKFTPEVAKKMRGF